MLYCDLFFLMFQVKDVKVSEVDFNPDFIARVIPRLDWPVVVKAAKELGQDSDLPEGDLILEI